MADNKLTYTLDLNNKDFIEALKKGGVNVKKLEKVVTTSTKKNKRSFKDMFAGVGKFNIALNQTLEVVKKVYSGIQAVSKAVVTFDKNTTLIQKRLKTTRTEAENLNNTMEALSETFGVDFNAQIKASTALVKEFGISGSEAIALLEKTASKVPDQFDEILEQAREYSSQFSQIGVTADEFLAISARAIQEGVFNDKAVDSVKEFNLQITEMTPAVVKALKGIGLVGSRITNEIARGEKTVFDVLQEVTQKMKDLGLGSQKTREILATVFRGAGEDTGKFLLSLADVNKGLAGVEDQISEAQEAQLKFNKEMLALKNIITLAVTPVIKKLTGVIGGLYKAAKPFFDEIAERDKIQALFDDFNLVTKAGKQTKDMFEGLTEAELLEKFNLLKSHLSGIESGLSQMKHSDVRLLSEMFGIVESQLGQKQLTHLKDFFGTIKDGFKKLKELGTEEDTSDIDNLEKSLTGFEDIELRKQDSAIATAEILKQNQEDIADHEVEVNKAKNRAISEADWLRYEQEMEIQSLTQEFYENSAIATAKGFGDLFGVLVLGSEKANKSIAESLRDSLINLIDLYVAFEVAKAQAGAPMSFGATLLTIGPIIALGQLGKMALNSIEFEEGGLTSGGSHASGNDTKFTTRDEPSVFKSFEGGEYFFSKKRTAEIGVNKLDAVNFGGADMIPFENGGSTSTVQNTTNTTNNTTREAIQVNVVIDGSEVASAVNYSNNNLVGSGGIITENT